MNRHGLRSGQGLGAWLVLWLGLIAAGMPPAATAFDIPTPQNSPQSKTDFFSAPKTFGPVIPLPATAQTGDNETGAGHLPSGVSVTTRIEVPPEGIRQRAPFLVRMVWLDRQKTVAHFRLHRPSGEHFDSRRIRLGQEIRVIDGRQVIAHTYEWAVTPLAAGSLTLDFARMTFTAVGEPNTRYEYQPVSRELRVAAIPADWPESLPMSRPPTLTSEPLPALTAGQPAAWQLKISGEGLTAYSLRHWLDEQLIGDTALGIGPAEVRLSPTEPIPADDPLAQTFEVRIPLLPDPQGTRATEGRLPSLRLPYLDREENPPGAALHFVTLPGQTLHWTPTPAARLEQALKFWWWRALLFLALLLALAVGLRDLWRRHAARQRHRRARQAMAQSPNAEALWHILQQTTGGHSTAELIARAPNPWFSEALRALDRLRFSAESPADFNPVRTELVRWLPLALFRCPKKNRPKAV
ncbi:hypothetical protein [Halothiobacillus sp. DCM-1]|uniref:hypothetical protein n=1 Tax=Halothiobacillus sp. DCM-1 TaxID=3112558 RepID=UPI0032509832